MSNIQVKHITEDDEIGRIIRDEILNETCGKYELFGEEETAMPSFYRIYAESIENFEMRDSDIIVSSYPKSGTTWTQEMVWLIANDLNFEGAKTDLDQRFPLLEVCAQFDYDKLEKIVGQKSPASWSNSLEYVKQQPGRRFIKTHLPVSLLPEQIQNGSKSPKMIYVTRNPKDVCVSFHHHGNIMLDWNTTLENFAKLFMTNKVLYGSFWKHVLGYWEKRDSPNLLIIRFEEMKKNLSAVIRRVASFLGKSLTEEQVEQLCKHLSFESMKQNDAVNFEHFIKLKREKNLLNENGHFIRSGTVGKYKEELLPETIKKFDVWIQENIASTSFGQQYDYTL